MTISYNKNRNHHLMFPVEVASPGIEPGSGASETLILSIVLRGHYEGAKVLHCFLKSTPPAFHFSLQLLPCSVYISFFVIKHYMGLTTV